MPRKSASKKQRGGSLASNRVMGNLDTAAATHDYVVSPRIRTKSNLGNTKTYELTGGACGACGGHKHAEGFRGCGATAPTQSGGARRITNKSRKSSGKNRKSLRKSSGKNRKTLRKSSGKNRKTSRKTRKQRGGQGKINEINTTQKEIRIIPTNFGSILHAEDEEDEGLYNNENPSSNKKKKGKQKGGGSAWLSSHNSGSLSNLTHDRSGHFTKHPITSRGIYLNPPNMGLAGSGLGGTYDNHAPV